MFQNDLIARAYGETKEQEAREAGRSKSVAAEIGRSAARMKENELDAWTVANVGLD